VVAGAVAVGKVALGLVEKDGALSCGLDSASPPSPAHPAVNRVAARVRASAERLNTVGTVGGFLSSGSLALYEAG
jgi:hypothetical protein